MRWVTALGISLCPLHTLSPADMLYYNITI